MTSPLPYPAPARPVDAEITIRYSRFVAALRPVRSREDMRVALDAVRAAHPTATHHCYAALLGPPQSGQAAMSDDGEPSGTAGRPIFTVIGHKGVGDVLVVVTRYFGGIKLGAGGLVRAYMTAAEAVLGAMTITEQVPIVARTVICDFAQEQAVRHFCAERGVGLGAVDYHAAVTITLTVPVGLLADLESFCAARGIAVTS